MDEEGSNKIPFLEGFTVPCNSSFTRDGQMYQSESEIFIKFRMDFSTQDVVLSVIAILM